MTASIDKDKKTIEETTEVTEVTAKETAAPDTAKTKTDEVKSETKVETTAETTDSKSTGKTSTTRIKKSAKKNIAVGQVHIKSTFNNTIVSITDLSGNLIAWKSAGTVGFKGSRKSTPFAAQLAADAAVKLAMEHGMKKVSVFVKGPGPGRETAVRTLTTAGLEVGAIRDVTPQAHNGVRPRKRRRV